MLGNTLIIKKFTNQPIKLVLPTFTELLNAAALCAIDSAVTKHDKTSNDIISHFANSRFIVRPTIWLLFGHFLMIKPILPVNG